MKRAPRSRQRHDLYAKYHDYDSEISDLLGECGAKRIGGFWIFMALALIAIGAFLLFVEGWLGAIWVAAGLAVLVIRHEVEKRKLINER